jgi:hypothetical protein
MNNQTETSKKMVTICAWSRKIKHGNDWISMEEFLTEEYGVQVSHGICPEKAKEMREERDAVKREKDKELKRVA